MTYAALNYYTLLAALLNFYLIPLIQIECELKIYLRTVNSNLFILSYTRTIFAFIIQYRNNEWERRV